MRLSICSMPLASMIAQYAPPTSECEGPAGALVYYALMIAMQNKGLEGCVQADSGSSARLFAAPSLLARLHHKQQLLLLQLGVLAFRHLWN